MSLGLVIGYAVVAALAAVVFIVAGTWHRKEVDATDVGVGFLAGLIWPLGLLGLVLWIAALVVSAGAHLLVRVLRERGGRRG